MSAWPTLQIQDMDPESSKMIRKETFLRVYSIWEVLPLFKRKKEPLFSVKWQNIRYNINGLVEELPRLPANRYRHVCALLPASKVSLTLGKKY